MKIILLTAIALLCSCTTAAVSPLSDSYENIIYEKPGVNLATYRKIMFGRLVVELPENIREPDSPNVQRLRKEFRNAFFRELQQSVSGLSARIVDQNARDVLLVKPYLVGTRTVTSDSPALRTDPGSGSLHVDGGLTFDISLLDSLSGAVLLRASETRSNSKSTDSADVDWVEVSIMAESWAKRVVTFLDEHLSR